LPPYFIPIIAFAVWVLTLMPHLGHMRLGLELCDQLVAAQYLASYMILLLAWALSGPLTAASLSVMAVCVSIYLFLISKEPAFLLQVIFFAVFYVAMVFFLLREQRKNNAKQIAKEKLLEDARWAQADILKKTSLKISLEKKVDRFIELRGFSEELKEIKNIQSAGERIVKEAAAALNKTEQSVLYLVNENRQQLSLIASWSRSSSADEEKDGSPFDQWVMKKGQGLMIEDSYNDYRFSLDRRENALRRRSVCASPLVTENKVFGVLRVSSSETGEFSADDLRLLDAFSNLASVTLRNMLLYAKMQEMATYDSLTGLYLYRHFQTCLADQCRRALLEKKTFGLILIDVDHFKRYNDEYGHAAGDIVLKNIASVILRHVGPTHLAGRYGGEEFLILLPDKNKKETAKIAEKLRASIESNKFVFRRIEARVTASMGVASFPEDGNSDKELVRTADKYLYRAKELGRNRVCGSI
jgi:diguanylate cyclase (GGDEF)-like protein